MLTIGKLAALADVRTDTLRYYERERLLTPAGKSDAGYRLYDGDSVRRIRFALRRRAQDCARETAATTGSHPNDENNVQSA